VSGSEDSPLGAAKNFTTENWRNSSRSKRNNGECLPPVCKRKNIFVFILICEARETEYIFDKIVLLFIIHVVTLLCVAVGIVAV
jgi:hypothetical protein